VEAPRRRPNSYCWAVKLKGIKIITKNNRCLMAMLILGLKMFFLKRESIKVEGLKHKIAFFQFRKNKK
jgi:hypothetical protein